MGVEHRSSGSYSSFIERARDVSLLRDLAIINERTYHELGPAPAANTSAESKPKPKMTHNRASTNLPLSAEVKDQKYGDEESMKPHRIAVAALVTSGALAACKAEVAPAEGNSVAPKPPVTTEHSAGKPAGSSALTSERIDAIIKQVMDQQYGNSFDAELNCWKYSVEEKDQRYDYCMTHRAHHVVKTEHGSKLYVLASNRSDIRELPEYQYSHLDMGLMGVFEVQLDADSKWSLLATSKDMDYGTIGDCGCSDAKFVKLGRDYYDWMFSSGGVWQGIAVLQYSLVAPWGKEFIDLASIPMTTEDDQDTEYKIEIDESLPDKNMYPLLVTKETKGSAPSAIKVEFDPVRKLYSLPAKTD